MGYETKVLLRAIYDLLDRCKDLEEAKKLVARMANVEEVIVTPNEDDQPRTPEEREAYIKQIADGLPDD